MSWGLHICIHLIRFSRLNTVNTLNILHLPHSGSAFQGWEETCCQWCSNITYCNWNEEIAWQWCHLDTMWRGRAFEAKGKCAIDAPKQGRMLMMIIVTSCNLLIRNILWTLIGIAALILSLHYPTVMKWLKWLLCNELLLNQNKLAGDIPPLLTLLPWVLLLDLDYNCLEGLLPNLIGCMTLIKIAHLEHNHLDYSIPAHINE
jgi:hypothetical protein